MSIMTKLSTGVLLPMLIVTSLAGCSGNASNTGNETGHSSAAESAKKELVIATAVEPNTLDRDQAITYEICMRAINEPLLAYNADKTALVGNVAESVQFSPDGKTMTIKLPKELTFSNGDPLNAAAVKASIERFQKLSPYASDLQAISKIDVPDPQTVVITTSHPSGVMLPAFTDSTTAAVNAAVANQVGSEAFRVNPVGFGLFNFTEWNRGNYMTFSRNEKFKTTFSGVQNKGPAHFDTLKVRFITNSFTRVSEIVAGNVDIVIDVPSESVKTLKNNADIQLIQLPSTAVESININPKKVSDNTLRKALALAIDRSQIVTALDGNAEPIYGPYAKDMVGFSQEAEDHYKTEYAFQLAKAKDLLKEAGYEDTNGDGIVEKDGKPLELDLVISNSISAGTTIGPVIQAQYQAAGMKVNIKQVDYASAKNMEALGEYDLMLNYATWIHASVITSLVEMDKLMENSPDVEPFTKLATEAGATIDMKESAAKYREAGQLLMDYSTRINLISPISYMATRKEVKGVLVDTDLLLNDATKE